MTESDLSWESHTNKDGVFLVIRSPGVTNDCI